MKLPTGSVAQARSRPSTASVVVSGRAHRWVDGQHESEEIAKRSSEPCVGQFVANASPFRFGDDETAAPQAREMVGHVGTRQLKRVSEVRRIRGTINQSDEKAAPRVVGERQPNSGENVEIQSI
jgi:hypothetical protein